MQVKCAVQALLALRYRQMFSDVAQGAPRVVQALRSKCAHDCETASPPICFGLLRAFARDVIIGQRFMYTS